MGGIWSGFVGLLEHALFWLSMMTGSTGFGIILFTVGVRLLMLPLTISSIRSSRKMQELQPMVKELQRKYGKDKAKLQEETIRLYRDHKVNPAGSCLPMLLQIPIFIAVYWAVLHLMDPAYHQHLTPAILEKVTQDPQVQAVLQRPFLGLKLGTKPFGGTEIKWENFQGVQYLVLPVLSILLQLVQQLMAMPRVQDPQQRAMSKVMLIMPLFFFYVTLIFPTGAVLYWVTSSAIGVVQTYFTSGWGSLANYLKFLPPDGKTQAVGMTPGLVGSNQAFAEAASEGPHGAPKGSASPIASPPQRLTFWDVVRPLTEVGGNVHGDVSGNGTDEQEATAPPQPPHEEKDSQRLRSNQTRRPRRRR